MLRLLREIQILEEVIFEEVRICNTLNDWVDVASIAMIKAPNGLVLVEYILCFLLNNSLVWGPSLIFKLKLNKEFSPVL